MLRTGRIRSVVGAEVGWAELPDALQRMAARQTTGRLVVTTAGSEPSLN